MSPLRWACALVALAATSIALPVNAQSPAVDPTKEWNWNDDRPIQARGITHHKLRSRSMGRDVGYNVYLPPGYRDDGSARYSVAYFLHGGGSTEYLSPDLTYVFERYDELILAGKVKPLIVVRPNGGMFSMYRDWPQAYNVKTETWLIEELLPHIDAKFPTIKNRLGRVIFGFSMGGGGALELAARHPDHFSAAGCMAGGAFELWQAHWKRERAAGVSLRPAFDVLIDAPVKETLASVAPQFRDRVAFRLTTGERDDVVGARHEETVKLLKSLGVPAHNIESQVLPGVGHDFKPYFQADHRAQGGDALLYFLDRHVESPRR